MEDAKRGKYANCKKRLVYQGYSKREAELACAKYLEDTIEGKDDFNMLFVDAYCSLNGMGDAIELSGIIKRSKSISLSRFSSLIKTIKTKVGLKVPHMGILPQKTALPMKNLNRLQTKMEKLITAEQKWLTAEQLEQRTQYAKYMRKQDAEELTDEEFTDSMVELYNEIITNYPSIDPLEAIDKAFELPKNDNAWILSNEAEIISLNDGLNNIIKAPIILAKEMIQSYTNEDGETEYHFKPYSELKRAAELAEENGSLDIIIEHQDWYDAEKVIGVVKEIRADDSTRTIRGMGYFYVKKLPEGLVQIIKDGEIVSVSIGFLAKLGDGGTWNGQDYTHTQESIFLRHLAVCLESVPRCPNGVCGINLVDSKSENIKTFIIINKDNYFYNISSIINDSKIKDITVDSKKETNKDNIKKNLPKINTMQDDSKDGTIPKNDPDDLEALLKRLKMFMAGDFEKDNAIARILAALGIEKKSDNEMDEKEFQDALKLKESEIEALKGKFDDAVTKIKEFEEKERLNFIKLIKKFGDKYSDEELEKIEDLKVLESIADAVSRFAPSNDKPDVIPVSGKPDKKKMEDELEKGVERVDFTKVFDDVNKEFNMSGL
jgi:hypothetical protein